MARVRLLRVLSEDPWRADVVGDRVVADVYSAFIIFDKIVGEYVRKGYTCMDYGTASIQLCIKGEEKIMIGIWLDQIPEDPEEF